VRTSVGDDDLICVRVDHQVGVVSDHYHLAFGLGCDEQRNEFINGRQAYPDARLVPSYDVYCLEQEGV
jgi:hypothetical protein